MARNGAGVYSNPYPNFVNGTVISSDQADANNAAIGTALTQSIAVDGQTTITANLPMNSKKFTGLAVGTAATDSLTLGQAQAQAFAWGGTASGGADAITIAPTPAITAYAVGQKFFWIASGSANTGAATIAISGLTAIAMQDGGAALAAGVHAAGKVFMGVLNTTSTCQIMQVQSSGDPLVISGLTVNGTADITGTTTVVALTASGLVTAGANVDMNGTELILDADADTSITADTDDTIDIRIAGADDFQFTANTFTAQSGSTIAAQALTATTVTASDIVTANAKLDLNGTELILDVDADTSITADTDDTIDVHIAGADDFQFTANDFTALSGSVISTNTIAETTAASGVTIDGLLIKDSKIELADGTAALPSLSNSGDVNTGVAFLAADTVSVTTGGVEQFRFGSNPIPGASKNLIHNGAMTVNQHGSTASGANNLDRFKSTWYDLSSVAVATVTKDADSPAGFGSSMKFDVTTQDTSFAGAYYLVQQYIEGQNLQHLNYGTSDALTTTFSFWFKTTVTGIYSAFLTTRPTDVSYIREFTVESSNTWEFFQVTFPGNTGAVIADSAAAALGLGITFASSVLTGAVDQWQAGNDVGGSTNQVNGVSSTSNNILTTGWMLEVGETATDFPHKSYGDELLTCQRYFEVHNFNSVAGEMVSLCNLWDDEFGAGIINYTEKRVTPTIAVTAVGTFDIVPGNGASLLTPAAIYAAKIGTRIAGINVSMAAGTPVGAGEIRRDGTDVCTISIAAEL